MDVTAPHRVTAVEWRQLRPWNLGANVQAARCHPSSWPFWTIVALTIIRPPLMANTEPGVVVNFTRPVRRPVAVVMCAAFFPLCMTAPAIVTIAFGWWALVVVVAALAVVAIRLYVPTLSAFQGPSDLLLLHDFIAAERGTRVPEAALAQLLEGYDEPIKLGVNAERAGLVRMYSRLGFVPYLAINNGNRLVMIRSASTNINGDGSPHA